MPDDYAEEYKGRDLKEQINDFLFQVLPGTSTINQLESLACLIHTKIKKLEGKK